MARVGEELKKSRIDSNMTMKQVAKKLGVSESFVNEVEQGKRVINEDLLSRYSKVFKKNVASMGLGTLEESVVAEQGERTRVPVKKETYEAPKTPVNELWNQAFGDNIKNVPVFDYSMKTPLEYRSYVVEDKKVLGYHMDKVIMLKVDNDDLKGFRIARGDYLTGVEAKEIQGTSIMLLEYKGKNILRKIRNLNNGNVELLSYDEIQKSEIATIKNVKPLVKIFKVEFSI